MVVRLELLADYLNMEMHRDMLNLEQTDVPEASVDAGNENCIIPDKDAGSSSVSCCQQLARACSVNLGRLHSANVTSLHEPSLVWTVDYCARYDAPRNSTNAEFLRNTSLTRHQQHVT